MSLADQINQIRTLASQGKTETEIAAAVGVEMGDVATVLAGTMAGGGSGSGPGSRRTIACPFAYNTPNLVTGAALYTPTIGDILHDAWVEIDTAWNGTTPLGDFGPEPFNQDLYGFFGSWGLGPMPFLLADGFSSNNGLGGLKGSSLSDVAILQVLAAAADGTLEASGAFVDGPVLGTMTNGSRLLPSTFHSASPFLVWVNQDGSKTGADPGSTQGAAVLYLDISTPQSA